MHTRAHRTQTHTHTSAEASSPFCSFHQSPGSFGAARSHHAVNGTIKKRRVSSESELRGFEPRVDEASSTRKRTCVYRCTHSRKREGAGWAESESSQRAPGEHTRNRVHLRAIRRRADDDDTLPRARRHALPRSAARNLPAFDLQLQPPAQHGKIQRARGSGNEYRIAR